MVLLRAFTVMPMYLSGFSQEAIYACLVIVCVYATYIHANVGWDMEWLKPFIVTPRFHHWHHGIGKDAGDVNFAIQFPFFVSSTLPPLIVDPLIGRSDG